MDTRSVAALMQFAMQVKEVSRAGWNKKFPKGHKCRSRKVKNAESSADHMFGLAFLAMLVADDLGVDRLKLMELAIVHDLIEAINGDPVVATEEGRKRRRLEIEKARNERAAIDTIASQGGVLGRRIRRLWNEFEKGKTPEAMVLHQLDKLEMCFQAERYYHKGHTLDPNEFLSSGRQCITQPDLKALLVSLEEKCKGP